MATSFNRNSTHVAKKSMPSASAPSSKGRASVDKHDVKIVSAGKQASVPHITLGTTRGNHSVSHPIN